MTDYLAPGGWDPTDQPDADDQPTVDRSHDTDVCHEICPCGRCQHDGPCDDCKDAPYPFTASHVTMRDGTETFPFATWSLSRKSRE